MKSITDSLNLSLLEIFSVLLPGAALLLLGWQIQAIQEQIGVFIPNQQSEWQVGLAFLGAAYFIGHVLFFLGSKLDDPVYDKVKHLFNKKETVLNSKNEVDKDAKGNAIKRRPAYGKPTKTFNKALSYKNAEIIAGDKDGEDINLYKWSVGKLLVQYPAMYDVVERHQAASKFFRSIAVVMFLAFWVFVFQCRTGGALTAFFLLFLSLVIYLDQRHKAVTQAYKFIIIVSSFPKKEGKEA